MRATLLLCLAACGGAPAVVAPSKPAAVAPYDPKATFAVEQAEASFDSGEEHIPGTVTFPAGTGGHWPAIVMFPGSGPTDRDWNSPLIPTKNGSGKLIAEELTRHGAVVLRFDKAAIGKNAFPAAKLGPDTYVGEGRAAIAFLKARPDVDPTRIFTLGNSEGGLHAMRTAVAEGAGVHGVILLASEGRAMRTILIGQISTQFDIAVQAGAMPAEMAKSEIDHLNAAIDDFLADRPIDPKQVTKIPGIQHLLIALTHPGGPGVRALLSTDPAEVAAKLTVPVLVMNGLKDLQVDPERDAKRLATAAGAHATLVLVPDANHVFKHEVLTLEVVRASGKAAQDAYNADDRVLDQVAVDGIESWLREHTK